MVFVFLLFFNARFWTGLFVTLVEVLKKSRKKSVLGVIFIILPSTILQIVRDRRFLKHQYFVICFTTDLKQTVFPRSRNNIQFGYNLYWKVSVYLYAALFSFYRKEGATFSVVRSIKITTFWQIFLTWIVFFRILENGFRGAFSVFDQAKPP